MKQRAAKNFRIARAFTLMEVMIAMVAFAIVLAAINSVFFGALKLRSTTIRAIDSAAPTERALAIIRNDLANIVPPGTNLFFGQLQTRPQQTNASTAMVGNMPTISVQGTSSPDFFSASAGVNDSTQWGEIQKISYTLGVSTNGGTARDLYRTVTRNLLPTALQETEQQALLRNVEALDLFYHDGTQWKEYWDSTTETLKLPRAIKVQITLEGQSARYGPPPVELIVALVDAGTNDLSQTTGVTQ